MARDDVNSVGDRYNQVGAAASLDEIYARTRRMSEVNTVAGERLRQEGRQVRTQLRNLREAHSLLSTPGIPRTPEIQAGLAQNRDEYAEALARRSEISQRFYEEKQVAIHRAGQSFISQINQFTGSRQQVSRINEVFSSSGSIDAAARQINSTGYGGFESMALSGSGRARDIATQLREAAINGAPEARIRELGGMLTAAESQIGVGRRGMQVARQMGLDPQSQFLRINEVSARASDRLGGEELRHKAEAGELPSLRELNEQIKEAASELNNLKEAFAEGKKPLDEFNKEAGAVADKLTKLEQQERAVAGAGGGNRVYGDSTGMARAGIDALRAVTVNQPIQALNIKGQMAAAQNEQYATVRAALSGDMSALSLVGTGAFQNAAGFARQQQLTQKILQTGEAGADVVDAGAGALNLSSIVNPEHTAEKIGKSVMNAGVTASDLAQGVTAGETSIQAYQSAMNAQREVLAVPSQFRQSYFNFGKSATMATRYAGAGRENMLSTMMGGAFLDQMQALRVDPNQAAAIAGSGMAEQGSAFNLKQISTARNLERAGFGPMEETMRRMGALATGGAADPNAAMGRIMEEAVSKGMDNSKAVSMMSDGISSIAQSGGLTATGVDATAGITALLGRALGPADGRSDINRVAAANNAITGLSGALEDTSVSYTNMVRNTRFRQLGMSGIEAAAAMKLTAPELAVMQKGGPEAERLATERGISTAFDATGKYNMRQVNKIANIQGQFLEMAGSSGLGMLLTQAQADATHRARAKQARGETLSPEEHQALMRGNALMDVGLGIKATTEAGNIVMGLEGIGGGSPGKAAQQKAHQYTNGTATLGSNTVGGETAFTTDAVQQTKETRAGRKDLESLDKVSKVLGAIEKAITPETMQNFATAASKAAGNMEVSAENFKKLDVAAGGLTTQFTTLQKNLEGLNTTFLNIGGFKVGGKSAPMIAAHSDSSTTRLDRHGSR